MVYQLPATTRVTVTSATKNSAVGAEGISPVVRRRACWCVAFPEGITLSGRKNRQLGDLRAQIWSQIPLGKPLQSAIFLEFLDQFVEGSEVRRIIVYSGAPSLADVVAANNFEHPMGFLCKKKTAYGIRRLLIDLGAEKDDPVLQQPLV